jgi:hypothetical protein
MIESLDLKKNESLENALKQGYSHDTFVAIYDDLLKPNQQNYEESEFPILEKAS